VLAERDVLVPIPQALTPAVPSLEAGSLERQTIPGIDGPVYALAEFGGLLVAGGLFTTAGDVSASNIAAWNGSAWEPLGSGTNGVVRAVAVFDGQLIAGGEFTTAGGSPALNVAAWNGSSWSPLGVGVGATVFALAVYDGMLFAGKGDIVSIESWNGAAWTPVGSGTDGHVYALTVHDGKLIAGGRFETIDEVPAHDVAAWNGSTWSSLEFPSDDPGERVVALTVYDGHVVAARNVDLYGGSYGQVFTWDGSDWSCLLWNCLGSYQGFSAVYALAVYGDRLVAGGATGSYGTPFAAHIAAWDGSVWSYLDTGTNGNVRALTVFDGELIAGGEFTLAADFNTCRIAAWDGAAWSSIPPSASSNHWQALGAGLGGRVQALTVFKNQLVAGSTAAVSVRIWNGTSWSLLGALSPDVMALTEWKDSLVAGGTFAPGCIARWDGATWQALGSGMNGSVQALTVFDDQLIAGGTFTTAGDVPANRIAAWNGVSWSPLGLGVSDVVRALAVYDGKLIAAGYFQTAGGVSAPNVAAWNGSVWSKLGGGLPGSSGIQRPLTVFGDKLIVGGGGTVYSWNGASWTFMGSFWTLPTGDESIYGSVRALTVFDGTVIAGGEFIKASNTECNRVTAWTGGTNWVPLSWGLSSEVYSLTPFGQRLIAGGDFTMAAGHPVLHVACWNPYGEVPVFIASFDARASEGGVDLSWDIAAAEEILGYKIYRALEGESGGEEIITTGLIAPSARSYRDDTVRGGERYEYTLSVVLGDGSEVQSQKVAVSTAAYALALEQNHPNPFNPSTAISFTLPGRMKVKLVVYDVQGKRVRTLVDATLEEGKQQWAWDGKDSRGRPAASGVYFYRLETADRKLTRKMLLLK
jgi:uncharacterized glyoxalase superfamily protein PhnB